MYKSDINMMSKGQSSVNSDITEKISRESGFPGENRQGVLKMGVWRMMKAALKWGPGPVVFSAAFPLQPADLAATKDTKRKQLVFGLVKVEALCGPVESDVMVGKQVWGGREAEQWPSETSVWRPTKVLPYMSDAGWSTGLPQSLLGSTPAPLGNEEVLACHLH